MTATEKVARVAHPVSSKEKWLAMIAYFDESGKPDRTKIVSVAALVAPSDAWTRFEFSWLRTINKLRAQLHPVLRRRYFHMTDYESRKVAPYKNWSERKRLECTQKLSSHIDKAIKFGSVQSILVNDWNEVAVPYLETNFKKRRGWYIFLLQAVLEDIADMVKPPRGETIACVFDENKEIGQAAKDHFAELKQHRGWEAIFGTATYGNSVTLPGLQGADILAFEGRLRVHSKVLENDERPVRKLLLKLTESGKITVGRFDRDALTTLNAQWMAFREYQEKMAKASEES